MDTNNVEEMTPLSETDVSMTEEADNSVPGSEDSSQITQDVATVKESVKKLSIPRIPLFGISSKVSFYFRSNYPFKLQILYRACSENGLVLELPSINPPNSDTLAGGYQLALDELLPEQQKHVRRSKSFGNLSEEQKDFVTSIHDEIKSMTLLSHCKTKCMLLKGDAGTGKTSTLEYIRDIENSDLLYIANTKSLCAFIHAKFKLRTMNFCRFFVNALNWKTDILQRMDKMQIEPYVGEKEDIYNDFFNILVPQTDFVMTIFLDDFNMFSPHALQRFIAILNTASNELHMKFLIILSGDFKSIPPVRTASWDYGPIIGMCEKIFEFKEQHRIIDATYRNAIMKLMCPVDSLTFLAELKTLLGPNSMTPLIEYTFPFNYIQDAYRKFDKTSLDLSSWLNELGADFFSKVLTLKAFAYANFEVRYMNLDLAFEIVHQLKDQHMTNEDIRSYICFVKYSDYIVSEFPNPAETPVLPLIRFFPYRMLAESGLIYDGSIVYLIDWNINEEYVKVYYSYNRQVVKVPFVRFYTKLYRRKLYGIPLELDFASTFHKAQGVTYTEDIAVSLNNVDHRDLFAILSRIQSSKQVKHLYINI